MLNKLKKISIRDIFGIFKFLIVLIPSIIYGAYLRLFKKHMWLICEREDMARDNGLAFFEYMQKEHPELKTYYAIDKKNPDYKYVKKFEPNIVKWASLKHYFLYMSATRNISSHKEGNPNQTLFTVLHLYLNLYNNRVFLQHGITLNNLRMFHYENTKFSLYVCGAQKEYLFIKDTFGYPDEKVKYAGFSRFDKLIDQSDGRIILFMPTWRRWLNDQNFKKSLYRKNILALINNKEFEEYLKNNNKLLYFYPHINVQRFFKKGDIKNRYVKLLKKEDMSVKELLVKGAMLITDYSSISLDFSYMKKPVIYYQPDQKAFRKRHAEGGWFNYETDAFGPVVTNLTDLLVCISNMRTDGKYDKNISSFFGKNDLNNSQRIYEAIIKKEG